MIGAPSGSRSWRPGEGSIARLSRSPTRLRGSPGSCWPEKKNMWPRDRGDNSNPREPATECEVDLMARRHGPLFESLTYDKAPEADRVIRPQAADSHQGPERDRSSNRPDRFVHPSRRPQQLPLRREASMDCRRNLPHWVTGVSRRAARALEVWLTMSPAPPVTRMVLVIGVVIVVRVKVCGGCG